MHNLMRRMAPVFSRSGVRRGVAYIPVLVPVAIAAFGSVAMICLLLDRLYTWLVWPLGLLAAWLACRVVVRHRLVGRPGSRHEQFVCDLLVLVAVLLWGGFNIMFTSQHVFTDRDPATYAVTAVWLTNHNDLLITVPQGFGDAPGLVADSAGFGIDPADTDKLFAQGSHMLPVLLGLLGRFTGIETMLRLNVLFGMAALLAVYAFARLIVRPVWTVAVTASLALALPLLAFSRDTFTEPLTAALLFGALAVLWQAQKAHSLRLWFLAGILAGAGAMVRIDAFLTVASFLAYGLLLLATARPEERRTSCKMVGCLIAGLTVTSLIGWLDVRELSHGYYLSEWAQLRLLFALITAIAVVGGLGVAIAWKTDALLHLHRRTKRWRHIAAALLVLGAALLLASRPFWYTSYTVYADRIVNGQPVVARDYAEQTVDWVMWYLGPVLTVVGGAGLALAAARATRRRDFPLLAVVIVVGSTALLYLVRPSIYPDQIWASRRLLPVIIPGLAILAAVALQWLDGQRYTARYNIDGRALATVLATLGVVAPLFTSYNFIYATTYGGQLDKMRQVCARLPENAAVIWAGESHRNLIQPTRAICDVPSVGVQGVPDLSASLAEIARSAQRSGYVPVVGVYTGQSHVLAAQAVNTASTGAMEFLTVEQTFIDRPRTTVVNKSEISLAKVLPDGSLQPLGKMPGY